LGPGIHTSKDGKIYDLKFIPEEKKAIAIGPLPEIGASFADIAKSLLPYIVIFLVLVVIILVVLIFGSSLKVKPRIRKMFYFIKKDKATIKEKMIEDKVISANDAKIKSIEEKVDELLAKKKIR